MLRNLRILAVLLLIIFLSFIFVPSTFAYTGMCTSGNKINWSCVENMPLPALKHLRREITKKIAIHPTRQTKKYFHKIMSIIVKKAGNAS
ncbi:MAG: hypothetical protein ACYCT7_03240 [bacterium]